MFNLRKFKWYILILILMAGLVGIVLPSSALAQEELFVSALAEGTTFIATSTGTYRFMITGGASEVCPPEAAPDHPEWWGWKTEVLIYKNRPIDWSGGPWTPEHPNPANWDFTVGDSNLQPTYEEAEQIGKGMFVDIHLQENEYVILVVNDSKGYFWDNSGGVYFSISIVSLCDFSTEPDIKIQRCFGGIGTQCEGNAPGTPFTKDEDTCLVYGWMSVGSILHDRCCYETNNAGYWCPGPMQGDPNLCADEWAEAKFNTWCTRIGAPRQWQYTFGPYPSGNTGDDTSQDLRAPVGARVNPEYQYLCPSGSGRCKDAKGRPLWDICGFYCECQ